MNIHVMSIPEELRNLRRWVCWRMDTRGDLPTKVPVCAENPAKLASSTNPETWSDFNTALVAMGDGYATGIGFVLGGGYCGIDLDKCLDPISGAKKPEAQEIIDEIRSYTEASPSGAGVHIIVKAKLPDGWRKLGFCEIYSDGRYFTMTGYMLGVWPVVEERTEELAFLHKRLEGVLHNEKRPRKAKEPDENFFIEKFPRSKGGEPYITKLHKETGKASCTCLGWKYRLRNGKPCWHVTAIREKNGFAVMDGADG